MVLRNMHVYITVSKNLSQGFIDKLAALNFLVNSKFYMEFIVSSEENKHNSEIWICRAMAGFNLMY